MLSLILVPLALSSRLPMRPTYAMQSQLPTGGPTVISSSGNVMKPTLSGIFPLSPYLSNTAQSAFVLDTLKTGTLISLSQLCDDDCIAIFTRFQVRILKNNNVFITGNRTPNGLWSLPLLPPPSHQANGILRLDQPKRDLAQYYHASLGSPVPSTLLRAIRRDHLVTFPGLTTDLIAKHLPKSIATVLRRRKYYSDGQKVRWMYLSLCVVDTCNSLGRRHV